MRKKNLVKTQEEVERISKRWREAGKPPIDEKIKPLVVALRVWGIKTTLSDEGHNAEGYHMRFPYVMFRWKYIVRVARILMEWNYRTPKKIDDPNEVFWEIEPSANPLIRPLVRPGEPVPSLEAFQQDAVKLGLWLQHLPPGYKWTE